MLDHLERGIWYHTGEGGGDGVSVPDVSAHQADHRKLVKTWAHRLDAMTVREKRKARPTVRRDIRELANSASVTRGDAIQHIHVATEQVNRHFPRYMRISADHIYR